MWGWIAGDVCSRIQLHTTTRERKEFSFSPLHIIDIIKGRVRGILYRSTSTESESHREKWPMTAVALPAVGVVHLAALHTHIGTSERLVTCVALEALLVECALEAVHLLDVGVAEQFAAM